MPKIKSKEKLRQYNMLNDVRRNARYMSFAETDAWIHSGKDLREFLGSKRFIEKGWRKNKNGELKLK